MKKIILIIFCFIIAYTCMAQQQSSFIVKGDIDKYYPVTFYDGNVGLNLATELELGRTSVHEDGEWRGSLVAKFRYHVTNWGNGAEFIDADIKSNKYPSAVIKEFVGGWQDISLGNSSGSIVIWLRGGNTTYYYKSNTTVNPVIYDGEQHLIPLQVQNGPSLSYKTAIDNYVNNNGASLSKDLFVNGNTAINGNVGIGTYVPLEKLQVEGKLKIEDSYDNGDIGGTLILTHTGKNTPGAARDWKLYNMTGIYGNSLQFWAYDNVGCAAGGICNARFTIMDNGNVGIGTTAPGNKLEVNGTIRTQKVMVTQTGWPDYVFDSTYQLPSLAKVSSFITEHKHLPEIPSAAAIEQDGQDLGEMQKLLLKKVEELTLYVIDIKNENEKLKEEIRLLKQQSK